MAPPIDIKGQVFGRLFVLKQVPRPSDAKHTRLMWECFCSCGNTTVTTGKLLRNGSTKSCGCLSSEMARKTKRKAQGHSGFIDLWLHYKYSAKQRNLDFFLSQKEFKKLTSGNCCYCGIAPASEHCIKNSKMTSQGILHSAYPYNGIDRIQSEHGYTLDNCVSCCKLCNYAKRALSVEDFISWARRLVAYQNLICK